MSDEGEGVSSFIASSSECSVSLIAPGKENPFSLHVPIFEMILPTPERKPSGIYCASPHIHTHIYILIHAEPLPFL